MNQSQEAKNKALVLEAFDTLFNKRDCAKAEQYRSPDYIRHGAHIQPSRDACINLIRNNPSTLKYVPEVIAADGDFVIVHGRFSGHARPANWIAADMLRVKDGIPIEHWDVVQDEATIGQSIKKKPMFGDTFPVYA